MAQQNLNLPDNPDRPPPRDGATPFGDSWHAALTKIQANFNELYTLLSGIAAAELAFLDGVTAGTAAASKALVLDAVKGISAFREAGRNLRTQAAPAAKTTSVTLTAAEIIAGLITGNQGASGAAAYTLPLGSDLETALLAAHPGLANDDSFDFSVINLSVDDAEDITVTTNTGWTLVGDMVVHAGSTVTFPRVGLFRARRTAADTYTLYRIG
jgi:hypothetical protein